MDENIVTFFTGFIIGFVVVWLILIVMRVALLFSRKERNMFKDQIEAGAELLNKNIPGWLEVIDLEKLDLSESCDCVVGQARPDTDFSDTFMELFPDIDFYIGDTFEAMRDHGFATSIWADYPKLTEEWKAYIQERRTNQLSTIE